ncbi:MAG: hypothetical protein QW745_07005 [Thermoplasmata archaeon]
MKVKEILGEKIEKDGILLHSIETNNLYVYNNKIQITLGIDYYAMKSNGYNGYRIYKINWLLIQRKYKEYAKIELLSLEEFKNELIEMAWDLDAEKLNWIRESLFKDFLKQIF